MKSPLLFNAFLFLCLICASPALAWEVNSPNGLIKAEITLNSGVPQYTIQHFQNGNWNTVIPTSALGIWRSDQDFSTGLTYVKNTQHTEDETYEMLTGKKRLLRNQYNELNLHFSKNGTPFIISFRAYDEGIGFRYSFSMAPVQPQQVYQEKTTFSISGNGKMWVQEYSNYKPVYERRFEEKSVGQNYSEGWCFPALLQSGNYYVLISETNVREDYCASHLGYWNGSGYSVSLPATADGSGNNEPYPVINSAMDMPWRFVTIGTSPKEIVESNLVHHLADPPAFTNTFWIKSGVSSFSWWADFYSTRDVQIMRDYIAFSDSLNLPYMLIDADWPYMPSGSMENLISYADSLDVGIWVWYNSGGPHSNYDYLPRDKMVDSTVRNQEFQWLQTIGAKGVKIDFFESDKQNMMKFYLDILRDAARYELMVSFHGCTVPKGWQRTYPHLMTMEAVKGAEGLLFDDAFRVNSPLHNVNLIYTRNVIGSMDYTPGVIGYNRVPHYSTRAHELAMLVAFESGIHNLADSDSSYLTLSPQVRALIDTPTSWDETVFLDGSPNQYAILARRKGYDWYLAALNGTSDTRNITIDPTQFLAPGIYRKKGISDHANNPQETHYEEDINFHPSSSLQLVLQPYGGFLFHFESKCPDQLITNGLRNDNLNYSAQFIESSEIIPAPVRVNYSAVHSALLHPGFNAESGSQVKVEIKNCPQD